MNVSIEDPGDNWDCSDFYPVPAIIAGCTLCDHPVGSQFVYRTDSAEYYYRYEDREIRKAANQLGVPFKPVTGLSTFRRND